jgi:hypothetical protein
MADGHKLIRPFGNVGSRYLVSGRGLILYRINNLIGALLCLYLVCNMLIYLTVLNLPLYVTCAAYFIIHNVLLAKTLAHADRVPTDAHL